MRMFQKRASRLLSVLMTVVMVLGVLPAQAFAAPEIKDGTGTVDVAMMHETKDQLSMCDPMFDGKADVVVKGDSAELKVKVVNPVPAFADQGADGSVKNVVIHYNGQDYAAESDVTTKPMMTAKADNTLFGLKAGEQYTAQVLTFNLPKAALAEEMLTTDAYVNVVMMTDVVFRMKLSNLDIKAEQPAPQIKDGVGTVDVAMMHETKDQLSMCDPMFDGKADVVVKGDNAELKVKVVNPIPAFADQGADGSVKNVVIHYNGQDYAAESDVTTKPMMTAKADNTLFGLKAGEEYTAQVLTFNLPKAALAEEMLTTDAFVNVVMMTDVTFRMKLSNLDIKAEQPDVKPEIKDGVGTVDVAMMHEAKDQLSMCDPMFDGKADVVVKGDSAELKVKVVNPVPAFADQGADGSVKNVVIHYNGQDYAAESDVTTKPMMTAKADNTLFGLKAGEQYTAQVLTFNLPKAALAEEMLTTDAFVNVVMMTDVTFRMKLSNLNLDAEKPAPEAVIGKADVTMLHEMKDQPSMCDIMFDKKADIKVTGDNAEVKLYVANPVPAFADQGKDGTVKNVVITYNDKKYEASSELGTDAKMTAKADNPSFGFVKGTEYPAQVLTFNLPREAIKEDAKLTTDAFVNVVMMTDVVFRMHFENVDLGGGTTPDPEPQPEIKEGKAVVSEQGESYEVYAKVYVLDGKIVKVELSAEKGFESHQIYIDAATNGMNGKFDNISVKDQSAVEGVDTVSGATLTSQGYINAVKDALGMETEQPQAPDFTFGSSNKELKAGVYKVPVFLRNADHHEKPSNAKDAFPAMAQLNVSADGTATLTTAMQPVTIGPITDMAYDVKVYQGDSYNTATKDAEIVESMVKPEPMPGAGKDVPTKISFVIPDHDLDGIYMNFTVDAMGPDSPDAWLELDYENAKVPGEAKVVHGSAKVNQFGKYTIYTDITVQDGVITGVDVRADDFISTTHKETNDAKVAQVKKALKNTWNGMSPVQENAETIFKAIMDKQSPDDVIDSVSGATYSAKAVRDAVMNAFELEYQDEIINVPESVEPGVYKVQIGYYSDVVWHSLVETVKTDAVLTVNKDKTMSLDFDLKSGTEKEPLYVLGFNGVYADNDRTKALTKEGCTYEMGLSSNDYEDENFAKGTQVVNHLNIPLLGGLNKIYNTNCYLYVPAMKRLNGELSGVQFENGKFNVDIFAKIYWDGMTKIGDVPTEPEAQVKAPVISPNGGEFTGKQEVKLSAEAGADIYYTTDKSMPTAASTKYTAPFTLEQTTTVKAVAVKDGVTSPAAEALFTKKSAGGGGGGGGDVVDKELKDGNYYVEVTLWHEYKDKPSMGDKAFVNNRKALVTIENGKATEVQVGTNPVIIGEGSGMYKSAVVDAVINGKHVDKIKVEKLTTIPANNEIEYLKVFGFDMPAEGQPEKLSGKLAFPITVTVPDTPMPSINMDARLMFDWSKAEKTTDKNLSGNSAAGEGETETEIKNVELKDQATGIKVEAAPTVLDAKTALKVQKITEGEDFAKAEKAMEGTDKAWTLYQVSAVVNGKEVQPNGRVRISVPCTDKDMQVYRINKAGKKVAVEGKVKDGFFVFDTEYMGLFTVTGSVPVAPEVPETVPAARFKDVPDNYWAKESIDTVVARKLFAGTSKDTFGPKESMTRAMFVTVLGRLAGVDAKAGNTKFTDVPADQYYAPYVAWAVENGIAAGTSENTFTPNRAISREEMAVFLVRYADFAKIELKDGKAPAFRDADQISAYAKAAVAEVSAAGLLAGNDDGTFAPKANASRAEVAALMARFIAGYDL